MTILNTNSPRTRNDIRYRHSMKNFFRKLFSRQKQNNNVSAFPADWRLTISDLFEELKNGKRKGIKGSEMAWARESERSLIPDNYLFPPMVK